MYALSQQGTLTINPIARSFEDESDTALPVSLGDLRERLSCQHVVDVGTRYSEGSNSAIDVVVDAQKFVCLV